MVCASQYKGDLPVAERCALVWAPVPGLLEPEWVDQRKLGGAPLSHGSLLNV